MDNPDEWKPNITPTSVFNPLKFDVETEYFDEKNNVVHVIIPSMQVVTYPKWLADILIKRVFEAIKNDRNLGLITEKEKQEILNDITI